MIRGIGTHIKVKNFSKSENFYTNLGFKKIFEFGPKKEAKEDYSGVIFEHFGCKLEIADGHNAVNPKVFKESIQSSKVSMMIYVDSLEEIIRNCRKHKIEIEVGTRHYYWGTLELVIKDPDGLVLVFIQPYNKTDAKKLNANETFGSKANLE